MDQIVGSRAEFGIFKITQHEKIRRQKERGEEPPWIVASAIEPQSQRENKCTFCVQRIAAARITADLIAGRAPAISMEGLLTA